MGSEHKVGSDVLVVGGGMAGLFAAIKAAEQGKSVTLADKGYAGRSGSTPHAFFFCAFDPAEGHDLRAWTEPVSVIGEYVNNREWTEAVFEDAHDRFRDLVSWGVEFICDDTGEPKVARFPDIEAQSFLLKHRVFGDALRRQALEQGVKIVDRVMVSHLLKEDARVVGAIGMAVDSYDSYAFHAKATVMCTGGSSFKPPGWPVHGLTGDGDLMAYQAGATVSGKEWNEIKSTNADYPGVTMSMGMWLGMAGKRGVVPPDIGLGGPPQVLALKGYDAKGDEVNGLAGSNFMDMELAVHEGRAPIYAPNSPDHHSNVRVGGAAGGLSVHTCEGIWPADMSGATDLPGLYAAGDSCCTMQVGATYGGVGYALAGAAVTGARAGLAAVEYAGEVAAPKEDKAQVAKLKADLMAPTERTGGFGPRWVTQMLQNTMFPYYNLYVKKGDRLQAALTQVEFMRDHLVPKLIARDAHELRLAHEVESMVHNAEAKLRTSIFRTESRGTHYREDFPRRDDPDWLAWVLLKDENGEMGLSKKAVPKEWWPDLNRPYEERYVNRYPGE